MAELNFYLGIKIEKTAKGYKLYQKTKIQELVEKFQLAEAEPYNTPMETGYLLLADEENQLPNHTNYRQAIRVLLYLATVTRLDISAAVNILSRENEELLQRD